MVLKTKKNICNEYETCNNKKKNIYRIIKPKTKKSKIKTKLKIWENV